MNTTARNERQARLVARKRESGQKRFDGWLPVETLECLRRTYPTALHGAPDWKRIAEVALKAAEQEREGHQGEPPEN